MKRSSVLFTELDRRLSLSNNNQNKRKYKEENKKCRKNRQREKQRDFDKVNNKIFEHTFAVLGDEPRCRSHLLIQTGRGCVPFHHNLSPMGFYSVMRVKFLFFSSWPVLPLCLESKGVTVKRAGIVEISREVCVPVSIYYSLSVS